MQTIKCDKHDTLILVLQPSEEFIFTNKLQATVVFYDSRGNPYLKMFVRGKCDENCPTVKKIFGASITPEDLNPITNRSTSVLSS